MTSADTSADTKAERRQHLGERAPFRAQHDGDARSYDSYSGFARGRCGVLPFAGDVAEEAVTRRRIFGEDLVSAAAVIADGGGADERRGASVLLVAGRD